ncbi:PH domain-containing protein [Krasilnikovia sp. MM14-A1259]|uniref:PH domain-containing protein n=1 Tax=Krasilnikovia sp. MM14-A1259 TaxID=3373539 RepID=UPI00399D2765
MPRRWQVRPAFPIVKLLGAVALLVLVLAFGRHDPVQWVLASAAAAGLAGWALSDLIAPVRLAADPDGITVVTGFARRRRLDWPAIERIRVDRRQRLGLRSELLEVDAGDTLYLFSAQQLGSPPDEVAEILAGLRRGTTAPGAGGQSSSAVR